MYMIVPIEQIISLKLLKNTNKFVGNTNKDTSYH